MSGAPRLPGTGVAWWFLAVFGLVLGGVLVGAAKLTGLSLGWAIVLAVAGFVAPAAVKAVQDELSRRRTAQQPIDRATAGATGDRLTLAGASLAQLGVQPAVRSDVDYVERDQEKAVVEALKVDRRVLVVGPSMAGKTRLAINATRAALGGERRVYVPRKADDLHDLLLSQAPFDESVLWLDDLDEFTSTTLGADLTTLRDRYPSVVVVATIRTSQLQRLQSDNEVKPVGYDVPAWFGDAVWLDHAWSAEELGRLAATRSGSEVLNDAETYGLGCYLGGAPLLDTQLRLGRSEQPIGLAVVQAAVDWRAVGLEQPITAETLTSLITAYVTVRHVPSVADQVKVGIAWATRLLNQTVRLLQEDRDGYRALDRVVDQLVSTEIPDALWRAALAAATLDEADQLGSNAYRFGQTDVSRTALNRVVEATHDPTAMYNLGVVLYESDRLELDDARRWWQRAAETGFAPAAYNLGLLLQESNPPDLEGSRRWWMQAAEAGDPDAAFNLGLLLLRSSPPDLDGARRWWQRAAEAGSFKAAYDLGNLLAESIPPDLDGARRWWEQAAKLGHLSAAYNLGLLSYQLTPPDLGGAYHWWQMAAHGGHLGAAYNLGLMLYRSDPPDLEGAGRWWQMAAEGGHLGAAYNLGGLLFAWDPPDLEGARRWWQMAAEGGDLDAAYNLGGLLFASDPPDLEGARRWWQMAAEGGHPRAAKRLSDLAN